MVLPRFVQAAINDEPLLVYGTGEQTRCFCDVRDVVEVLPRFLADGNVFGSVINVGRDTVVSISELASRVVEVLGSGSSIKKITYEEAYGRSIEDMIHRRPDISRLESCFEFTPRYELDQTILDLADSIRRSSTEPDAGAGR
jgi:UDP-glucose 4-epimerase